MHFQYTNARDPQTAPADKLKSEFAPELFSGETDAQFLSCTGESALGVTGMPFWAPVCLSLTGSSAFLEYLDCYAEVSHLFRLEGESVRHFTADGEQAIPETVKKVIFDVWNRLKRSPGSLNEGGEHIIDLKSPQIATHFNINLLIGNRTGCENPLLTTPKSAVDAFGRGSFRASAAEQVLATRCVLNQDENGEPANRQFYLIEDNRQIFYSANAEENVKTASCRHAPNHTVITYETECGLRITRTIFILPQMDDMPQATEVQRVKIENRSGRTRRLRIVMTGVFGIFPPDALANDIVYVNIVHESGLVRRDGRVCAIAPHDYPRYRRFHRRFASLLCDGEPMDSFCVNYPEFVGSGTIEHPEHVLRLPSAQARKNASFFAMGKWFTIAAGETKTVDEFVGMVYENVDVAPSFDRKLFHLLEAFRAPEALDAALCSVKDFYSRYSSYISLHTSDPSLDAYVNNNLPFQVYYQSFVSRSFAWTQKAHRQIGFREIQDMYASMYYMTAMGNSALARDMISQWAKNVYKMGYANHNFFWEGKEPGQCSDDQLWLAQAVYRYISLTDDYGFLDEELPIAGCDETRTLFETLLAAIRYSGKISVGKHGLPLLDNADWNDCLKLDADSINGPEKERRYLKQLEKTGQPYGTAFESNFCESVMNAFLLKIAADEVCELAAASGREEAAAELKEMSRDLHEKIQTHCWKENFFTRAMINSEREGGYTYVGAKGDRLSADPEIDGSYFLNSFSWSVLSDVATEEQIVVMLGIIKKYLVTEAGLKLCSPCDLDKISTSTATEHYFPGDRENGAVFKHAAMMSTAAMFKACKEVKDEALAEELASLAFWMLSKVFPYQTMKTPFITKGNPRFCTQYNNSETLENIGPMLSGTASWLSLTIFSFLGIQHAPDRGIRLTPVLPPDMESAAYTVRVAETAFRITVEKGKGFRRPSAQSEFYFDGSRCDGWIPNPRDGKTHEVRVLV